VIGVVGALLGSSGVVWVALRFNREDAAGLVGTMRDVSAELRTELARTQKERDGLRDEVTALRVEIAKLRGELAAYHERRKEPRP